MYCYNTSTGIWSTNSNNSGEQQAIYNFMCSGLKMDMTKPTESYYLGTSVGTYEYTNAIDRNYSIPDKLVESGKDYTTSFANVGLSRLKTYIRENS